MSLHSHPIRHTPSAVGYSRMSCDIETGHQGMLQRHSVNIIARITTVCKAWEGEATPNEKAFSNDSY